MRRPYLIGTFAAIIAAIGGIFSPAALVQAWHFSVISCLQPSLGCLLLLLIFQCTGGRWGECAMPALTAGRRLIPWCLLAWVPMVIFLPAVYHWATHPAEVGDRHVFLNWPFFAIRLVIYLAVFGGLSMAITKGRRPAAGGLILFALIAYFLAVDSIMALAPKWFSSGFPIVFMSNQAMMAMAMTIALQATLNGPTTDQPKVWRDLGNLLLTTVIFWSYVSFTQFLIIWAGNLKEEIEWYHIRSASGWSWVTVFLALCSLFGPFFVLLSRAVKEDPRRLRRVALLILASQVVYLYWLIVPSFPNRGHGGVHWLDPVVLLAAGSFFYGRITSLAETEKENAP